MPTKRVCSKSRPLFCKEPCRGLPSAIQMCQGLRGRPSFLPHESHPSSEAPLLWEPPGTTPQSRALASDSDSSLCSTESWAWKSRKNEPRLEAQQACLLCLLPTSQSKSSLTGGDYQSSGSCPVASSWSSPQMRGLELVSDLLWPCHSPNYSFSDSPGPGGSVLAPQVISKEQRNAETARHLLPNLTLFPNTGPPENDQLTATHSHPYGPSPSATPFA